MALYTERSNAHLNVATDSIISFSTRCKSKDTDVGNIRGTELHSSAAQKFPSGGHWTIARNVDHIVCVTKLHAVDS
jgi:hypothetical protein